MIESRIPCPVCLGVHMVKQSSAPRKLTLDLCPRCGGIWFEPGEFRRLRSGPRVDLARSLTVSPHSGRCHACTAILRRDEESCAACGNQNRIDCPECARPMHRVTHDGVTVDVCTRCRGVWFDEHELSAIWTVAIATVVDVDAADSSRAPGASGDGRAALVDALVYGPDVGAVVIEGSVRVAGSAIDGLAAAPELAGSVAEAAGSVFEALVSLVGAVLDGL